MFDLLDFTTDEWSRDRKLPGTRGTRVTEVPVTRRTREKGWENILVQKILVPLHRETVTGCFRSTIRLVFCPTVTDPLNTYPYLPSPTHSSFLSQGRGILSRKVLPVVHSDSPWTSPGHDPYETGTDVRFTSLCHRIRQARRHYLMPSGPPNSCRPRTKSDKTSDL